jgi:hypothetical protein
MNLIIENIDKMNKAQLPKGMGDGLWEVDNIYVGLDSYDFVLQRWWGSKINYVCKLSIMREGDLLFSGLINTWYYRIQIDGHKTIHYLTRDELKDMNKVMKKFSDVLYRIPIN